jgi:hypothetical protein
MTQIRFGARIRDELRALANIGSASLRRVRSRASSQGARTVESDAVLHSVDRFSRFGGTVRVSGWVYAEGAVDAVFFETATGQRHRLVSYGLASPDVARRHGPRAANVRFDDVLLISEPTRDIVQGTLVVVISDQREVRRGNLVANQIGNDPFHQLTTRFAESIRAREPGRLLEVGSRARSGILRRDLAPAGWACTGLDIIAGEGVDVVGDAHRLSKLFEPNSFDAAMSFSVLEHLAMPWKFVLELNRVMKVGALGIFTTHQCWPLHEAPWDFWRFSSDAWQALLNHRTGFRIVDTAMGEPAVVVANLLHPVTDFGDQPAYLGSSVLFEKVGGTELDWPVELEEVVVTAYPQG